MRKRGQITIFIIIGIVILLSASLFFYLRSTTIEKRFAPELIPAITQIPEEARPVRLYTEACIFTIAEEGFRKLGEKGGYIEADFKTDFFNPTEAEGVQFSRNSDLKIPYWWYLSSDNDCAGDCVFETLMPPLFSSGGLDDKSIEAQVENYIDENLKECLADYAPFTEQGFEITELGELETTTLIGENDVSIFVDFPIKIEKESTSHTIEQFHVILPLNFKNLYELAKEIVAQETNFTYIENNILNVITSLSGVDPNKLPPKTESEFKIGSSTFWSKTKVKSDLESILPIYVSALQVPFTKNYERRVFPDDDIKTSVYATDIPVNLHQKYNDFEVRFDYLAWWPIYFDLNCNGDLCTAESANNPFLFVVGYQRYDFVYDISFPVVVDVKDPFAFNGEGYTLKFAIEANVRNNEAIDQEFPGYEGISIRTQPFFCDFDMRNSGEITVVARDAFTEKGVKDVNVMYTCGDHSCAMGITNESGQLKTPFPVCSGGIVSFLNYDYFLPAQSLDTETGKRALTVSEGYLYIDKDITVRKRVFDIRQNKLNPNTVDLKQKEQILITLEKIPESIGEDDVTALVEFWGNQSGPSRMIRLVPGTYEVTGTMILYEEVIIPEETRTVDGFMGIGDIEYTIPEVKFEDGYPSGGMILNQETGYIRILPSDLYKSELIEFIAISSTLPEHVEEIGPAQDIEGLSSRFRNALGVRYKR